MIILPKNYNYCSAFLTFACNMKCGYCINKIDRLYQYSMMPAPDWVKGLNRLELEDVPITLSGGEPTLHPNFYQIIKKIHKPMDLLTNGQFNVRYFMDNVGSKKFKRDAPYASIRFSYHPGYTNLYKLLRKARFMQKRGYSVGVWAIAHPDYIADVMFAKKIAETEFKIDFRIKEFLGWYNARLYGTYKYPQALDKRPKKCICKPSELLIAPDGRLFRCHRDLYIGSNSYGHILNGIIKLPEDFMKCDKMGVCNPCDLKMKFDRFQVSGHCSVEIKEIK